MMMMMMIPDYELNGREWYNGFSLLKSWFSNEVDLCKLDKTKKNSESTRPSKWLLLISFPKYLPTSKLILLCCFSFSSKKRLRGVGLIFNPKIYLADFGPLNRTFWIVISKKNPKMRGEGQRPFGTFLIIHPFWRHHPSLSGTGKVGVYAISIWRYTKFALVYDSKST